MKSKNKKVKPQPKKSIDDMSVDELLEELRKSQGPGDCLMEIRTDGIKITKGK